MATANDIFDSLQAQAIELVQEQNKGRKLTSLQLAEAVVRTHTELFVVALEKLAVTHPARAAAIRAAFVAENS